MSRMRILWPWTKKRHWSPYTLPSMGNYLSQIPNHFDRVCKQTKKPKDDAHTISIVQAIDDQINISMSPSLPRRQKSPSTICFGWLHMIFFINNLTTRQPLFFCEEADRIYLSRKACIDCQSHHLHIHIQWSQAVKRQFMHLMYKPSLKTKSFTSSRNDC